MKLQTSLYDASTGRSGGGNFQLVTKTGTNPFNGSVYYYLQNEKFNANDFFFNKEGIDRPKARRNEGGFTIGGPVVKDSSSSSAATSTRTPSRALCRRRAARLLPRWRSRSSARTARAQAIANAFNQARDQFRVSQGLSAVCNATPLPAGCLTANDISPVALNLLNLRNPATGDFILAAPRASGRIIGFDRINRTGAGAITTRAFQFGIGPDDQHARALRG